MVDDDDMRDNAGATRRVQKPYIIINRKRLVSPIMKLARSGADVKRNVWCAGINRQEAEDENSSRERSSDPLGPEFCAGYREVRGEA